MCCRQQKNDTNDYSEPILCQKWSESKLHQVMYKSLNFKIVHYMSGDRYFFPHATGWIEWAVFISLNRLSHIKLITIFHCLCLHLLLLWNKQNKKRWTRTIFSTALRCEQNAYSRPSIECIIFHDRDNCIHMPVCSLDLKVKVRFCNNNKKRNNDGILQP